MPSSLLSECHSCGCQVWGAVIVTGLLSPHDYRAWFPGVLHVVLECVTRGHRSYQVHDIAVIHWSITCDRERALAAAMDWEPKILVIESDFNVSRCNVMETSYDKCLTTLVV